MGREERAARTLAESLKGLKVAVDVQHLYKAPPDNNDHGAAFVLADGRRVTEAQLSTQYAAALCAWLRARGAAVVTNDPVGGRMLGSYASRNRQATAQGVNAYLACHVNAGGGSYSAVEYMVGTPGAALAQQVGAKLAAAFPIYHGTKAVALVRGQRGAVCIEDCARTIPAVILEPFFGDNPKHQVLATPTMLRILGEAIGQAVAAWWVASK